MRRTSTSGYGGDSVVLVPPRTRDRDPHVGAHSGPNKLNVLAGRVLRVTGLMIWLGSIHIPWNTYDMHAEAEDEQQSVEYTATATNTILLLLLLLLLYQISGGGDVHTYWPWLCCMLRPPRL